MGNSSIQLDLDRNYLSGSLRLTPSKEQTFCEVLVTYCCHVNPVLTSLCPLTKFREFLSLLSAKLGSCLLTGHCSTWFSAPSLWLDCSTQLQRQHDDLWSMLGRRLGGRERSNGGIHSPHSNPQPLPEHSFPLSLWCFANIPSNSNFVWKLSLTISCCLGSS